MRSRATAALVALAVAGVAAQRIQQPFVPVGVVDDRPGGLGPAEIAELRTMRFSVVASRDSASGDPDVGMHARLLPGPDADPGAPLVSVTIDGVARLSIREDATPFEVRRDAWVLTGRGYRGVVFDGWTTLHRNRAAFQAAADFADVVTRNAALFAPLRASPREVRVTPATDVFARFVESPAALVLVAANMKDSTQRVTFSFRPDIPEAIWQNMESGAAVNFVAGPDGPTYVRTFAPADVVVLMIRKQYK